MQSSFEEGPKTWEISPGVVVYECGDENCLTIADVIVSGIEGSEHPACHEHLNHLGRSLKGLIEIILTLDRPACFRPDCNDVASTVMEDMAGPPKPVCHAHHDDLSWIETPKLLHNNNPGWSHE